MSQRLYRDEVELYDLAFSWDVSDEVGWLLGRLNVADGPILEPGCGTGRVLAALAERGVRAVGIDHSTEMVAYARRRLSDRADLIGIEERDMTAFDLGRRFLGAICPVNTLAYLTPSEMSGHLTAMARHLEPGARYLVQLDLRHEGEDPRGSSTWSMSRGDTAIEVTWSVDDYDPATRREQHRSVITVTSGPRCGDVLDETHRMTSWTPDEWRATVAASPFGYLAVHDGDERSRPALPLGSAGELLWHVLEVRRGGTGRRTGAR